MYYADIHTHSIASGHGTQATIADQAKEAARRHLTLLGISDHAPSTLDVRRHRILFPQSFHGAPYALWHRAFIWYRIKYFGLYRPRGYGIL